MKNAYLTFLMSLCVTVTAFAEDWMKPLPDETYVAVVSIPGSHDTATGNGMSFPAFGQTQDISMSDQWSIGIRAFDLRPKVSGDHLQVNHGILSTNLRFDDALYLLRDSLIAHPTEFAVVHLLYANGFDSDKSKYKTMLLELLGRDDLKDYLVDFRSDLTVGDMRGKILLLSRDQYDTKPVGGFFSNWCGWIDWNVQTQGKIKGAGTGSNATATLYMQDLAETYEDGKLEEKCNAIRTMLDFSTTHTTSNVGDIVWVYNFASAYSNGSVSTANGYRDNAAHTHATIIDYLDTHAAGPTGIILMDYVGVEESNGYATRGKEVVEKLIANNFKYLTYETDEIKTMKAWYNEILADIKELRNLRTAIKSQISKGCPDVAGDFSSELDAVGLSLNKIQTEVNKLYKAGAFTVDYSFDAQSFRDELDRILLAAQEAQKAFEEGTAVRSVAVDGSGKTFTIYSLSGELLEAPRRGAVNIYKYEDGTVRKVWVNP